MATKTTFKEVMDAHMTGSKLSRSATVSVRFDPRLRYLTDIAARTHRRTVSSYTEWAVANSLNSAFVDSKGTTVEQAATHLWDTRDCIRIVRLADLNPNLMSFEEQQLHKLMTHVLAGLGINGTEDDKAGVLEPMWDFLRDAIEKNLPVDEVMKVVLERRDEKVTAVTIDRRIAKLREQIDDLQSVKSSLMDGKAAKRAAAKATE